MRTIELDPAELDGLPDDFKRAHPVNGHGKVALTTNNTDYQPFLSYAKSAKAREAVLEDLPACAAHPKNLPVLGRMLEARKELANLLGFPTWADYITGDKMIGTRQAASDFIQKIATAADDRLTADYKALLARKQRQTPGATAVDAWDSGYLQEQVKAEQYKFDSQSVRPYFEYRRVKQGVMDLTSRMFGITYRAVPDAAVWHPDVEAFDVLEGSRLLGRIYLDMYPARQQVQARRPVHADQRQGGPHPARGRAGLQFPEACRIGTGADAAFRRRDVLPRVRPPAAPRPRRAHALGRHLGRGDRVGLRRSAVADAGGVGLDARDAADLRPPLPDERADPGRTGEADEGRRRVRQGHLRPAADVLRRHQPRAAHAAIRRGSTPARSSPSCRTS